MGADTRHFAGTTALCILFPHNTFTSRMCISFLPGNPIWHSNLTRTYHNAMITPHRPAVTSTRSHRSPAAPKGFISASAQVRPVIYAQQQAIDSTSGSRFGEQCRSPSMAASDLRPREVLSYVVWHLLNLVLHYECPARTQKVSTK